MAEGPDLPKKMYEFVCDPERVPSPGDFSGSLCGRGSVLVQRIQNWSLPVHTVFAATQNDPEESEKCTFSSILMILVAVLHVRSAFPSGVLFGVGVVSHGRER